MKRKCLLPVIAAAVLMLAVAGCSSKKESETVPPAEETADSTDTQGTDMQGTDTQDVQDTGTGEENTAEQSTLTGTIDEIKDFMFVVVDPEDRAYAFPFEDEKPEGLDGLAAGDEVVVTYTGVLSEIDNFEGEIISVEKVN